PNPSGRAWRGQNAAPLSCDCSGYGRESWCAGASAGGMIVRPVRHTGRTRESQSADDLSQAGVDFRKRRRARTQVGLGERVERRVYGVEIAVQVFGLAIDVEQAGDDLADGGVPLQEAHGAEPVVRIVVGGNLLEHELRAVVLLDDLDRSRLVGDRD